MKKSKLLLPMFIACTILLAGTSGYAATVLKKIEVELNSLSVKINNKALVNDNIVYKGNVYIRADKACEVMDKTFTWDKKTKLVAIVDKAVPTPKLTPSPAPTPTTSATSGTLTTDTDIVNFLNKNYATLKTELGNTNFTFLVYENDSNTLPYDYCVMVKYDFQFFYDLQYSNKVTTETREKVKSQLKDNMELIAKALIKALPNKKFEGSYYDSWYKYPALKVDLIMRNYFSWCNYTDSDSYTDMYSTSKLSDFRWVPTNDNSL